VDSLILLVWVLLSLKTSSPHCLRDGSPLLLFHQESFGALFFTKQTERERRCMKKRHKMKKRASGISRGSSDQGIPHCKRKRLLTVVEHTTGQENGEVENYAYENWAADNKRAALGDMWADCAAEHPNSAIVLTA
jgi:hypothetical protein